MLREYLIKGLLLPFSLLFGLGVLLRDLLYKTRLLRSIQFNIPVIGVGNLAVGGSGKTPHVEYLITLLQPYLNIGVMSRGYNRKTKGYRLVNKTDTAKTVGDEPKQYSMKYPNISVAVSESRSIGIPQMLSHRPNVQALILDDSYQHRSVTAGLNILLTDYSKPYFDDFLLPSGRLREWPQGAARADIIIVSKCPHKINDAERQAIINKIAPEEHQNIYFTKYRYQNPYHIFNGNRISLSHYDTAILVTAIASIDYLMEYIDSQVPIVSSFSFEDHHYFSPHEVSNIAATYNELNDQKAVIITTEKDATRLGLHYDYLIKYNINIYVLPIQVEFLNDQSDSFDREIQDYLLNFTV